MKDGEEAIILNYVIPALLLGEEIAYELDGSLLSLQLLYATAVSTAET